jgi:lipopolysaccharide biosynthesis glycosyltransferase
MAALTLPSIEKYAKKCNADLIFLTDKKGLHTHYKILQFYDLFDTYDNILSMDIDIIVRPDCPNIFNMRKENTVLMSVFEDVGSRQIDRRTRMQFIQDKFGPVGWTKNYINTGFCLFSKDSKPIFEPVLEDKLWMDLGYDDVYLMYKIHQLLMQDRVVEFPNIFNFMSLFAEDGTNPLNAFILHFAGQGNLFGKNSRIENIKYGLNCFKQMGYEI